MLQRLDLVGDGDLVGQSSSSTSEKTRRRTTCRSTILASQMPWVGTLVVVVLMAISSARGSIHSVDAPAGESSTLPPNSNSRANRLNSRFLRTFPSLNVYSGNGNGLSSSHVFDQIDTMGRREGDPFGEVSDHEMPVPLGVPMGVAMSMGLGPPNHNQLVDGNSPVFYIRLPPAPYILVPGLGYVSPHPYNSPMAMGLPSPVMVKGSPGKTGLGAGQAGSSAGDLSSEQSQKSALISLPLKFLSNGRPSQIESPKKPSKAHESKGSALISGGKYSFNGKPTAVFVVRSPAPANARPAPNNSNHNTHNYPKSKSISLSLSN